MPKLDLNLSWSVHCLKRKLPIRFFFFCFIPNSSNSGHLNVTGDPVLPASWKLCKDASVLPINNTPLMLLEGLAESFPLKKKQKLSSSTTWWAQSSEPKEDQWTIPTHTHENSHIKEEVCKVWSRAPLTKYNFNIMKIPPKDWSHTHLCYIACFLFNSLVTKVPSPSLARVSHRSQWAYRTRQYWLCGSLIIHISFQSGLLTTRTLYVCILGCLSHFHHLNDM